MMKSYTCLIVDDNEIERDAVVMYLQKIGRLIIKAICSDGAQAAEVLLNQQIDIVFSDIDMPELSGINLLKSFNKAPVFIFITSYSEYAAESFDLDALDFVVKPATFERLLKASSKAIEYLDLKNAADLSKNMQAPIEEDDDYFFIKETKGFTRLNYADVIFIESMGDFSRIFTSTNKYITLVNLKNLERQLPSNFIRVHKQYIINLNLINTVSTTEVLLAHNHYIPISLANRADLMEKIANKTLSRSNK